MAHHENRPLIAFQEALEPLHALKVEMVGRLVQKEDLGVTREKLSERDAHLPATRELARATLHVLFFEAQAEEHCSYPALKRIATHCLIHIARFAISCKRCFAWVFTKRRFKLTQALLLAHDLMLSREHLFEDGIITHLDRFLFKVAGLRVLRDDHAPFVRLILARDDVEQRGLACPIWPNERKTIEFFQAQRDPRKQFPGAKRFRDLFEL